MRSDPDNAIGLCLYYNTDDAQERYPQDFNATELAIHHEETSYIIQVFLLGATILGTITLQSIHPANR